MFKTKVTPEALNAASTNTMIGHLGIEFLETGPDRIRARMPVDARTVQNFGMLHGGASVTLAETIGSLAANFSIDQETHYCVGLEINANHIRAAHGGYVFGETNPIHIGRSTQVWEIRITDDAGKLVCISRLTMATLARTDTERRRFHL